MCWSLSQKQLKHFFETLLFNYTRREPPFREIQTFAICLKIPCVPALFQWCWGLGAGVGAGTGGPAGLAFPDAAVASGAVGQVSVTSVGVGSGEPGPGVPPPPA